MHGRKRRRDDNYTCNGEEDGAKLNQMEEKDGQIKAKEESNRWSWKIPKLELRGQGRKKHVVKKMKQAKLCSSRLYQICHVVDTSSSPHLNIIHIHIRSLVNRSVVLLWDSQFLCHVVLERLVKHGVGCWSTRWAIAWMMNTI